MPGMVTAAQNHSSGESVNVLFEALLAAPITRLRRDVFTRIREDARDCVALAALFLVIGGLSWIGVSAP
jgi:hypothetical protein